MDFERVLRDLTAAYNERGVRYALIGGFALVGRDRIDWERVRDYFALFGRENLYAQLREEIDRAV